jgi:ABC-type proline/glycine betaine transport system ATPase subunit
MRRNEDDVGRPRNQPSRPTCTVRRQGHQVELPKRRLTVFTGVSGSGKSSLVFATIAAESQRLINENSAFVLHADAGAASTYSTA